MGEVTNSRLDYIKCYIQGESKLGGTSIGNEAGHLDLSSFQEDAKNKWT